MPVRNEFLQGLGLSTVLVSEFSLRFQRAGETRQTLDYCIPSLTGWCHLHRFSSKEWSVTRDPRIHRHEESWTCWLVHRILFDTTSQSHNVSLLPMACAESCMTSPTVSSTKVGNKPSSMDKSWNFVQTPADTGHSCRRFLPASEYSSLLSSYWHDSLVQCRWEQLEPCDHLSHPTRPLSDFGTLLDCKIARWEPNQVLAPYSAHRLPTCSEERWASAGSRGQLSADPGDNLLWKNWCKILKERFGSSGTEGVERIDRKI